ncbi:uncharacterized protein LOC124203494 [Daphnia pulex]|uniref:uncharacterized protein LOC124203494 n=1 Tax=Daphnia pulex TaxID=6669 RepID=UPI001EE14538|nr:uncharacterized protein LOC124203494 [Daphnia pulex]
MSQFKVACARNLPHDFKEEKLREVFEVHGPIQRVKILEDYAYVRIENRDDAVHALDALDGYDLYGTILQISLAKVNCVAKSPYQQGIVKFDRKAQVYRSTGSKAVSLDEVVAVGVADPPAGGFDAFAVVGVADPQAVGLDVVVVVGDAKAPVLGLDTAPLNDAAAPGNCLVAALEPSKESSNKDETYKRKVLHLSNVPHDLNEETLKRMFEVLGPVVHVKIIDDFAFIHFESSKYANKAFNFFKNVIVSMATSPSSV